MINILLLFSYRYELLSTKARGMHFQTLTLPKGKWIWVMTTPWKRMQMRPTTGAWCFWGQEQESLEDSYLVSNPTSLTMFTDWTFLTISLLSELQHLYPFPSGIQNLSSFRTSTSSILLLCPWDHEQWNSFTHMNLGSNEAAAMNLGILCLRVHQHKLKF